MNKERESRYPGIYSFSERQSKQFFGRKVEIRRMLTLIEVEDQVLLYGKSGLGKTSLLNAGVIPRLEENMVPIPIRFFAYGDQQQATPVQQVIRSLREKIEASDSSDSILQLLNPEQNPLWFAFKQAQLSEQVPEDAQFVLVFDQFEELFTYPEELIATFKEQLFELTRGSLPKTIALQISSLRKDGNETVTKAAVARIRASTPITSVFAIRTDRLSLLDQFSDRFPDIRRNFFELQPLTEEGAREAIVKPAKLNGTFRSQSFSYADDAVKKILSFLSDQRQKPIESTQLQIICERIESERMALPHSDSLISPDQIPDFQDVFREFYQEAINQLPEDQQNPASRFVEEELIKNHQRMSVDETVCLEAISQDALDGLVDSHLLRREPNHLGRLNYELSHDTLVQPIQELAEKRRQEEAILAAEQKAEEERLKRLTERKRQRRVIAIVSIALLISLTMVAFAVRQNQKAIAAQKTAEQATDRAESALAELQRTNRDALIQKAQSLIRNGGYQYALINLEEAQKIDPDSLSIIDSLIQVCEQDPP